MSQSHPPYKPLNSKSFRRRREQLGFTTERMATLCKVSSGRVVRKWEAGDNEVPEGVSLFLWVLFDRLSPQHRTQIIDAIMEGK